MWIYFQILSVGALATYVSFLLFKKYRRPTIRVLMYHKISTNRSDILTVTVEQLEQHLTFLRESGFEIISATQFLKGNIKPKTVLLTFDDAYLNNLELAYPVLKKHSAKAIIFVPTAFVGRMSSWDSDAVPLMSLSQLKSLDDDVFELGLHSHQHQNYKHLSTDAIDEDLSTCIAFFKENDLQYVPLFAYPYGGRPKSKENLKEMYSKMSDLGIKAAFRIGNRHNALPITHFFEVQRLDIRGTDSFAAFKRKVRWGKL